MTPRNSPTAKTSMCGGVQRTNYIFPKLRNESPSRIVPGAGGHVVVGVVRPADGNRGVLQSADPRALRWRFAALDSGELRAAGGSAVSDDPAAVVPDGRCFDGDLPGDGLPAGWFQIAVRQAEKSVPVPGDHPVLDQLSRAYLRLDGPVARYGTDQQHAAGAGRDS